jgi:hypothetical protein
MTLCQNSPCRRGASAFVSKSRRPVPCARTSTFHRTLPFRMTRVIRLRRFIVSCLPAFAFPKGWACQPKLGAGGGRGAPSPFDKLRAYTYALRASADVMAGSLRWPAGRSWPPGQRRPVPFECQKIRL